MAETVWILGAGASVDAGAPLMYNFLDVAEDLYFAGKVDNHKEAFETIFHVRHDLQNVYNKSHLDLINIESLFGAIEMAGIIKRLGSRTDEKEIAHVRASLVTLIVKTLEESIKYELTTTMRNELPTPTETYRQFAQLLLMMETQRLNSHIEKSSVSVITFNYDVALDYALKREGVIFDYCLEDPRDSRLKLLKLNGSTNWARCQTCGIVPFNMRDISYTADLKRSKMVSLRPSDLMGKKGTWHHNGSEGHELDETAVIVPPTWNKKDYHGDLTNVWKHATTELSTAKNLYIAGYSLPESDAFFRYLFALGTMSETTLRNIYVIDPHVNEGVGERFRKILGAGVIDRFVPDPCRFDWVVQRELKEISKL